VLLKRLLIDLRHHDAVRRRLNHRKLVRMEPESLAHASEVDHVVLNEMLAYSRDLRVG